MSVYFHCGLDIELLFLGDTRVPTINYCTILNRIARVHWYFKFWGNENLNRTYVFDSYM